MKTLNKTVNGYSIVTDDTQNAAALADRIEALGYSVSEIRWNRFTDTALILIVDNANLGREKLETIL